MRILLDECPAPVDARQVVEVPCSRAPAQRPPSRAAALATTSAASTWRLDPRCGIF